MNKIKSKINKKALIYYLSTWIVPRWLSIFDENLEKNKWFLQFPKEVGNNNGISFPLAIKNFKSLLNELISNYVNKNKWPYWLLLSWWSDSSSILSLLRNNTEEKIYTLSFIYKNTEEKTINIINKLTKEYNTIHKYIILDENDLLVIDEVESMLDNPVIFDYWTIMDYKWLSYFSEIWVKNVLNWLGDFFMSKELNIHLYNIYLKIKDNIEILNKDLWKYKNYTNFVNKNNSNYIEKYLNFENWIFTIDEINDIFWIKVDKNMINTFKNLIEINGKEHWEIFNITIFDSLYVYEWKIKTSKLIAKEKWLNLYMPFCDEKFINFVLNLPDKYRLSFFEYKYILRESFKNDLPEEIFIKNYSPWNPDFYEYFWNKEIYNYISEKISFLNEFNFFDKKIDIKQFYSRNINSNKILTLIWISSRLKKYQ